MADVSGINYAHHSWGPWRGCHPVSAGCQHCYAARDMRRFGQDPHVVVRAAPATFQAPLRWQRAARAAGERRRVFVCSWSDFWSAEADAWRPDAVLIMFACPDLDFMIPTKRPQRMAEELAGLRGIWPGVLARWWLGVTAENQEQADLRIPLLRRCPAAVHLISVEPMLGPVDLRPWLAERSARLWVVCGGESGPGARPMHPQWVRDLRDQCRAAGVPFYYKQGPGDPGEPFKLPRLDGRQYLELPAATHKGD